MNIDNYSYIKTTHWRLFRRLVRDAQFRGYTASETLARWPKVRTGEEKHIFPFQNNADLFFNSGLTYELAVLKLWAEPRLAAVESGRPQLRPGAQPDRPADPAVADRRGRGAAHLAAAGVHRRLRDSTVLARTSGNEKVFVQALDGGLAAWSSWVRNDTVEKDVLISSGSARPRPQSCRTPCRRCAGRSLKCGP
jgi:hypothetical protein